MHLTSMILLAAAGASAHPSGHAHMHRHFHEKRTPVPEPAPEPNPAVGDLVTATVMGKVVSWTNTYDGKGSPFVMASKSGKNKDNNDDKDDKDDDKKPKASPTPSATPSSAPAAQKSAAPAGNKKGDDSKASGKGVTSKTPFCNGAPKMIKRATAAQIAYTGNTGSQGDWGCNMMLVADSKTADQYQYTSKFTNNGKNEQTCTCFNKIGPTGLIDGFFHQGINWTMAPGSTQYVAFDSNTQGGCVCNSGTSLRKTTFGQFAGTWVEFDFENTSNKGWSGSDASALVAMKYGMEVDGLKVCSPQAKGICSTIFPGGTGDNAYLGGMEDLDGIGLNIPPGKCQLEVDVSYNK